MVIRPLLAPHPAGCCPPQPLTAPREFLRAHTMRPALLPTCSRIRLFAALVCCACNAPAAAGELSVLPAKVELADAYAGRQLLVSSGGRDLTRSARYASSNPTVAR